MEAGRRTISWPIETADLEAVAVLRPSVRSRREVLSAASDASFREPALAFTSHRSAIPPGGVNVAVVAVAKKPTSLDSDAAAVTVGAATTVPAGFAWLAESNDDVSTPPYARTAPAAVDAVENVHEYTAATGSPGPTVCQYVDFWSAVLPDPATCLAPISAQSEGGVTVAMPRRSIEAMSTSPGTAPTGRFRASVDAPLLPFVCAVEEERNAIFVGVTAFELRRLVAGADRVDGSHPEGVGGAVGEPGDGRRQRRCRRWSMSARRRRCTASPCSR